MKKEFIQTIVNSLAPSDQIIYKSKRGRCIRKATFLQKHSDCCIYVRPIWPNIGEDYLLPLKSIEHIAIDNYCHTYPLEVSIHSPITHDSVDYLIYASPHTDGTRVARHTCATYLGHDLEILDNVIQQTLKQISAHDRIIDIKPDDFTDKFTLF